MAKRGQRKTRGGPLQFFKKLKPTEKILLIIAVASLIIAVASLIIAINQTKQTAELAAQTKLTLVQTEELRDQTFELRKQTERIFKHYILSTNPRLSFWDKITWPRPDELGLYIRNDGLGPAIIKKATLEVDGKTYDACEWMSFQEAIRAAGLLRYEEVPVEFSDLEKDTTIKAGEKRPFIVIYNVKKEKDFREKFENYMARLLIKIEYESLYGEKFKSVYRWKTKWEISPTEREGRSPVDLFNHKAMFQSKGG